MGKEFKFILITGATSGIGYELAKQYAKNGVHLFLIGRNTENLNKIKNLCQRNRAIVKTAIIDVKDKEKMQRQLLAWDREYPIDLVIANAGISQKGVESFEQVENVLNTNINGVVNTIYPLIEKMKERKYGSIAIISSMAGFRGIPFAASYSASKNAVRALGDALRPELKEYNIDVSVICPGFIKTPMTDTNPFPMPFLLEVEKSAKIIITGLKKQRPRIMFPWQMRVIVWVISFLPVFLTDKILMNSAKKKRK